MRFLLSDASGLTARQVATILGREGHHVEALSSDPLALTRFTRYVRRIHRLPAFGTNPLDWFDRLEALLHQTSVDVLLPTQEQVSVLALRRQRLLDTGVDSPLPAFSALMRVQDKVSAAATLAEIGLAQPQFVVVRNRLDGLAYDGPFPVFIKAPIGTASSSVRLASDRDGLQTAMDGFDRSGVFDDGTGLLIQAAVSGPLAMIQAVFQHGRLVASHANLRIVEGASGGAALKESIDHAAIRSDLAQLDLHLDWEGALSVDAVLTSDGPRYIDVNPRLVEPMNAFLSGVDLVGALIRVAAGDEVTVQPPGKSGVRSHQSLLALLGAARRGSRGEVLATMSQLARHHGEFASSTEELTPTNGDWAAAIPLAIVGVSVLAYPAAWRYFSGGAVSRYSLTRGGWRSLLLAARGPSG